MPVSRGSIRHTLPEDAANVARSLLGARTLAGRASRNEKEELRRKIARIFGARHVVLFPYARSAFLAIVKSLNLPPKSEILLTPISIGPMLEVILALGHKPVFVDIELETFCVDLEDLKKKLAAKPACFLLTYLFGYIPNVEAVVEACRQSGTVLLEDISHNIGGSSGGKPLGLHGEAGIYSASLLKYVDGYNGAFVVTNNEKLAALLEAEVAGFRPPDPARIAGVIRTTFIWNFSLRRGPFDLVVFPLLWTIKKLSRTKFEEILGPRIVLKMPPVIQDYYFEDIASVQCATISRQLDRLDGLIDSRRASARAACEAFRCVFGRALPCAEDGRKHTFWQFVIPVKDLVGARDALFRAGVETGATNLMNLADVMGCELAGAKSLKESHIFIPLHARLGIADYEKMFSILRPYCEPTFDGAVENTRAAC
jgi:dTDP-4-amino-4,6-dideoxygalactose transaminase